MPGIHILDSETIDKIAAGEVVERPSSVVKELVENAIDAGAGAVTVEAREGGIEFLRITDNGCGIGAEQLRTAFLRHATSKIKNAEDLTRVSSLGFRGEALSSVAAVAKAEIITKPEHALTGIRYVLEGAVEKAFEEVGAPEGTTFIIRNLFFNTPVRRKFLKQPATEGGYIADLMEHLALSRPDISFKFILGNQVRFHTSGNGDLKEVIYRIYGREVASQLIPVHYDQGGIQIEGYLGKPVLLRSNRNFEIYFINGRFIRSQIMAKAIEEGYKEYLMQHKFPFCVLHLKMDSTNVDVNVHPTKMDVRFSDGPAFSSLITEAVKTTLKEREMIPEATLGDAGRKKQVQPPDSTGKKNSAPEPFEKARTSQYKVMEETRYEAERGKMQDILPNPLWARQNTKKDIVENSDNAGKPPAGGSLADSEEFFTEAGPPASVDYFAEDIKTAEKTALTSDSKSEDHYEDSKQVPEDTKEGNQTDHGSGPVQMNLFEEKLLTRANRTRYHIIGQIFDTYWLVQFEEKLFIIDQHAAHEKVKYERIMKQYQNKEILSQVLMPPVIVSLSGQEEAVLKQHMETFEELGFQVELFGGREYALRSVPSDLYGCGEKELFLEVLDELAEGPFRNAVKAVEEKIASMACKAAVKGNNTLSLQEAETLIDELLTLENPYNCPHGRPTIIAMSRMELEKKFNRIK